ncbi:hypothetical protein P154DRAFT_570723 [Amniculicola lignicola CBS 123094]|uniref:F-box domain-containing protein n=1 Tax=Amniculicola lignicola CBS 123094 TaxID=1392246 RepID=A0A6A5WW54_9PLEO|nr:hypothetical protein P154DRAFT_570723 [Amniculicola lignicola CBS 123094]
METTRQSKRDDHQQQILLDRGHDNFTDLNDDIHHLVLSELFHSSPHSLSALARTCKALNILATPYLYRAIHFPHCIPEPQVWAANTKAPTALLEKLHTTWPSLKIRIHNHRRGETDDRSLDEPLFLTRGVEAIDIDIYAEHLWTGPLSEWKQVTDLVTKSKLRALRLEMKDNGYSSHIVILGLSEARPGFHLDMDTTLPSTLEELTIAYRSGPLFDSDPVMFARNLYPLKRLDLDILYNPQIFAQLNGRMPNLKALRFNFPCSGQEGVQAKPVVDLISSLGALEELDIANAQEHFEDIFPAIELHKATLHTLILRPSRSSYTMPIRPSAASLRRILHAFPHVRHFGFDVPFTASTNGKSNSKPDPEYIQALSKFTLPLKTLDLYLHLPIGATAFTAEYSPNAYGSAPFPHPNKPGAKDALKEIADTISRAQKHPLERMNVTLARTGFEDRGQPFFVETSAVLGRSDRDDAEELGTGKWKVEGKFRWYE